MEFDLENPFTGFQEQSDATISHLFASESHHMPSRNFLHCSKTSAFYLPLRRQAISLILRAQFHCTHDPFLPYLAVNYMDRFISCQDISQGRPWVLRLIVISCLSLAAKMKKTNFSISGIQRQEGLFFNSESINRMELLILDALNWRMRSVTPFPFVHFFISLFELKDPSSTEALKNRATDIIFKAFNDVKLLEFKPSVVAASAILLSCHELFPSHYPSFRCSISSYEYVNKENLEKCYDAVREMVKMEAYESMIDRVSSSRTPMSVLDHHCTTLSESSETKRSISHITCSPAVLPEKRETKQQKINAYRV